MGKYLDVSHLDKIRSCKIVNENELQFENGYAIATVEVSAVDFYNEKHIYQSYAIIREIKNSKGEVSEYGLAHGNHYFEVPKYVWGIEKSGNHYIFDILTGNDEGSVTWHCYYQFDLEPAKEKDALGTFKLIGEIKGKPTFTKNPDIVILGKNNVFSMCKQRLYSLSENRELTPVYSCIDDIDGTKFMVTDRIAATSNSNYTNDLMFDINKDGVRQSKIFSKNKGEFRNDELDTPYETIVNEEKQLLEEAVKKQMEAKKLLMQSNNEEQ